MSQTGQWQAAEDNIKAIENMHSAGQIDKKIIVKAADGATGNTALMFATMENKITVMERLVAMGCDVNKKNKEDYTALHFASMYSREDTVNWLLAKRANPNLLGGPIKQSCVHLAAARQTGQSPQVLRQLLASSNKDTRVQPDMQGNIPIFCAIESGNNNVCKELLQTLTDPQVQYAKQPMGDTVLHLATRKKDESLAKTLIESGAPIDAQNSEGQTVLHLASIQGSESIMRVLFLSRANASIADNEDRLPIHLAAERGHTKLVEFLVDKFKASVYERTRDGSTLMHIAAVNGHPETAMALFERGVPLLMPNKFGARSIHTAAREGHVNVVITLIKKGEKVDTKTADNFTPLHIAVEAGKAAVVEALLGYGADVTLAGGKNEETALHIAARIDEAKGERCTKMLVKSGADPNIPMKDGRTPVHIAALGGNLAVLRALLQNGGDAQLSDKEGETSLHKACKACNLSIIRELIQFIHGFVGHCRLFVNKLNKKGETALHYICCLSKTHLHFPDEDRLVVKLLLESGVDVSVQTEATKESAFHYVSLSGNNEVLQEILDHTGIGIIQICVNKQSSLGWAPLLCASTKGHEQVVKNLLACNARVDVFDSEGRSALHLAAEFGSMAICEELLAKNAFVNSKTKNGLTALHYAASKGKAELIEYLVTKHGAMVDSMSNKRQTPLHLNAQNGWSGAVRMLSKLEAMPDFNDELDQKPIHLAAQNDHYEVVKVFLSLRPSLVSAATKDGNTMAHLAARKGSTEVLSALFAVDKSLVTNAINRINENSPLHLATEGGHLEVVQLMLENGLNPQAENKLGFTPIHLAAKCGHADVFDVFASSGVSLRQTSSKIGMTALHISAYFGEEDITRELFKHIPATTKTDIPKKPENALIPELAEEGDLTALHLAAYSGSENVVRAVLNQPSVMADGLSTPSGYTALHLACLSGHVGVVGLLLSRSTELLKVQDKSGQVGLHVAATHGHYEMCQVLLGQGAEFEEKDKNNWTPLHCASKAGYLNVAKLLVDAGASTTVETGAGKVPLWYAVMENNKFVVEFLLRQDHDTHELIEDQQFIYNLMKLSKADKQKTIEDFIYVSPAPAETAAKLSALYRETAETEKERATDLLEIADYCEDMAKEMVILSSHIETPSAILNAVDLENTQYIDILIENEQKLVVSEYVVQQYLQEIWRSNLDWPAWKMFGFFVLVVFFPPLWFIISVPIEFSLNKVPMIKFMSYLTSHIYFMFFLSLTCVGPPHTTIRDSMWPYWYEYVCVFWYGGLLLAELTNPGAKGGFAWIKQFNVFLNICAVITHIVGIFMGSYYWSLIVYIRNQFMGFTLLMCCVQIMDFLAFHHLFGPWAIIIGELMMDVGKFLVVLSLFMLGYALQVTAMNQPFGVEGDYGTEELNPQNLTLGPLFEEKIESEGIQPFLMLEILFFALFGITGVDDMMASEYIQEWTLYVFKAVFATYLVLTVIVLINLLVAMMSDTYVRIQEQSDIEWKFGLAKLIRNMQRTNVACSPLNLFTTWMVLIREWYYKDRAERYRAKMKFRRAMREEIMQKAPGMKFVVEEKSKKKKKMKPRVIHALGNIKWGFDVGGGKGVVKVEQLQSKWDRDHHLQQREHATFGSNESLDEFRMLSKAIPWATVVRNQMETKGRGAELKPDGGDETDMTVRSILKSIKNLKNDAATKDTAKKWTKMPNQTKTKVIDKWEKKARE